MIMDTDEIKALRAENERLQEEAKQYRALGELQALDIAFVTFAGSVFLKPTSTKNKELAFNILCSDTFEYACADSEAISLSQAPKILELYRSGGFSAVLKWVQEQRGGPEKSPFIRPVQKRVDEEKFMYAENERLRMQLAACGVLSGCNTPDSLERNRQMHPDFLCSPVQAVIEAVQREIKLIAEVERLRAALAAKVDK